MSNKLEESLNWTLEMSLGVIAVAVIVMAVFAPFAIVYFYLNG